MENQKNIVESALEAATKPFAFEINGQTMIANNHGDRGWSVEQADTKLQKEPMRPRGTYTLHDCASFISYVGNHRQEGTQIIINAPNGLTKKIQLNFFAMKPFKCYVLDYNFIVIRLLKIIVILL